VEDCGVEEDVVPSSFSLEHETPNHGSDQPLDNEVRDERGYGNNRQADDDLSPVGELEVLDEVFQERPFILRPGRERSSGGANSAARPRTVINTHDILRESKSDAGCVGSGSQPRLSGMSSAKCTPPNGGGGRPIGQNEKDLHRLQDARVYEGDARLAEPGGTVRT
jgi:hypothetical protein